MSPAFESPTERARAAAQPCPRPGEGDFVLWALAIFAPTVAVRPTEFSMTLRSVRSINVFLAVAAAGACGTSPTPGGGAGGSRSGSGGTTGGTGQPSAGTFAAGSSGTLPGNAGVGGGAASGGTAAAGSGDVGGSSAAVGGQGATAGQGPGGGGQGGTVVSGGLGGTTMGGGTAGMTAGGAGLAGAGGTAGAGAGQGGGSGSAGTGGSSGESGATCPGTLKAGDSNQTITSDGMPRKFIVHLPTGYAGDSPLPVIFDFHPLGGTGQSQKQASGWDKKCDSVGCIAVFPDSGPSDNSWNVGYCCSNSQQQMVDDVKFTRDMIQWLAGNTCIDPKRVYASGCSNGGGMAYILACNAADVIAAVAPVDFRCITGEEPANAASLTPTNNTACTCQLPRPISVMAFDEGQDMSIVPYNGGKTLVAANCPPGGSCAALNFPSAEVNFQTWANFDKCTGSPTKDPGNSICQDYTSCDGGTQVSLCTAASSNHCGSYGLSKIVDTAWDMFQKQALP